MNPQRLPAVCLVVAGLAAAPGAMAKPPPEQLVPPLPATEAAAAQQKPAADRIGNSAPGDSVSAVAPSAVAPRLPLPPLDDDAPPGAFLLAARQALAAGRRGEALEALERAESRALIRSVKPSLARVANTEPLVQQIADARGALAANDRLRTLQLIDAALQNTDAATPPPPPAPAQ